jgi:DNA-binding response OmpR family regulator
LEEIRPEITIIDEVLPDISGLEVLEHISLVGIETNAVIITGMRSTRCAVEAIRLGAREVVEKPFAIGDLLAIVAALAPPNPRRERRPRLTAHAALRVVRIVVKVVESRRDPKTVKAWARIVGASPGAIRSWCRAAKVSSKHSLDLARLLRAVVWSRHTATSPEQLLDVIDPRTLNKLLRLGDATGTRERLPTTIEELLREQRWVQCPEILAAIRRAMRTLSHQQNET